ncbi:MAG: hypothetical protein KID00_00870 [Clostridium argentinense]|nr:hypothetical protein [Clostridium argentinense]
MTTKTKPAEQEVETFIKEQLLSAKKYSNRKDILGVLLEDGKQYSFEQVDTLMDDFMKGKVK